MAEFNVEQPYTWQALRAMVDGTLRKANGVVLFRKEREIGSGAYGSVFVYKHELTNELVAIKTMRKSTANPHMLKKELGIGRHLRHPNIARTFAGYVTAKDYLIIMEFIDGDDLNTVMATDSPMEQALACRYILQLIDAIQHLHSNEVLHRDIKFRNVMTVGSYAKLIDFGMSDYSVVGTVTGTCCLGDYMAPECMLETVQGPPADIFGLGVILYRLLVAGRPFSPPSNKPDAKAMFDAGPDRSFENWNLLPANARELIVSLLQGKPSHRPTLDEIRSSDWVTANKAAADSISPAVPAAAIEYLSSAAVKDDEAAEAAALLNIPLAKVVSDVTNRKNSEAYMTYQVIVCRNARTVHGAP